MRAGDDRGMAGQKVAGDFAVFHFCQRFHGRGNVAMAGINIKVIGQGVVKHTGYRCHRRFKTDAEKNDVPVGMFGRQANGLAGTVD